MSKIVDDFSHSPIAPQVKVVHYVEPDMDDVMKFKGLQKHLKNKPIKEKIYKTFNIDNYGALYSNHKAKANHLKYSQYLDKAKHGYEQTDLNQNYVFRPYQTQRVYQKQYEAVHSKPKVRKNAIKNNKVSPFPIFI